MISTQFPKNNVWASFMLSHSRKAVAASVAGLIDRNLRGSKVKQFQALSASSSAERVECFNTTAKHNLDSITSGLQWYCILTNHKCTAWAQNSNQEGVQLSSRLDQSRKVAAIATQSLGLIEPSWVAMRILIYLAFMRAKERARKPFVRLLNRDPSSHMQTLRLAIQEQKLIQFFIHFCAMWTTFMTVQLEIVKLLFLPSTYVAGLINWNNERKQFFVRCGRSLFGRFLTSSDCLWCFRSR